MSGRQIRRRPPLSLSLAFALATTPRLVGDGFTDDSAALSRLIALRDAADRRESATSRGGKA